MIAAQLVACRSAIGPKDELEGMMAAQLIAAHNAAMECYRRAMINLMWIKTRSPISGLPGKGTRTTEPQTGAG
jgi:hypothetical protein